MSLLTAYNQEINFPEQPSETLLSTNSHKYQVQNGGITVLRSSSSKKKDLGTD